jgi:hypothetical protein
MNYEELLTKLKDYPPDNEFRVYCPFNKRYYNATGVLVSTASILIKKDDPTSFKKLMYNECMSYRSIYKILRNLLIFTPSLKAAPIRFVGDSVEFKVL